jgi:phosphatidylserine decarboxylase
MEHKDEWIKRVAKPFWHKSVEMEDYQLFMRDSPRPIIADPDNFYSCADGIVLYNKIVKSPLEKVEIKNVPYSVEDILGEQDLVKGPALICGVFMTFADVHVNRVPYTSTLEYKLLDPIQSMNFSMDAQEEKIFGDKIGLKHKRIEGVNNLYLNNNARMLNTFYIPKYDYKYYVVQIADFDVNTILPFTTKQKDFIMQGDRFSFIRWGSQCDLILPLRKDLNIRPLIPKDMHVEAGVDKVASLV